MRFNIFENNFNKLYDKSPYYITVNIFMSKNMATNDLENFMNSATLEIQSEYMRIQKRVLEDPGTAGDQGEENWASLLRNWLPPAFQIVTKGRILNHNGDASPQVDVIILQPEYPKHLLDKKLYLAGGVLAVFECKLTLVSNHIEKFIQNTVKIKDFFEARKGTPYKELHKPILSGLLAHSHSWKRNNSNPVAIIEKHLFDSDQKYITHPNQSPDIICVSNLATWSTSKMTFLGPKFFKDWSKMETMYGKNGSATSTYIRHSKENRTQNDHFTPLGALLTSLLVKLSWEYSNLRSLARYFILSNIQGTGEGFSRHWDSSIYSDEIRDNVEKGHYLSNGKFWDEWSLYFG